MICPSLSRCRAEQHPRERCARCRHTECAHVVEAGLCVACQYAPRHGAHMAASAYDAGLAWGEAWREPQ